MYDFIFMLFIVMRIVIIMVLYSTVVSMCSGRNECHHGGTDTCLWQPKEEHQEE